MLTHGRKARRRFGTLGVAMILAAASLVVGAGPASAAGDIRYENVGNPGWCLDGNSGGDRAYLHRCGSDFQVWTVGDAGDMVVKHKVSGNCLQALPGNILVGLGQCGTSGTLWYATGKNGWVKFINYGPYGGLCLQPTGTWVGGQPTYDLVVASCNINKPEADPKDLTDVPNIVAWRFH